MTSTQVLDIKAAVRQRDGFACTECGMTQDEHRRRHGRILEVHRLTPGSEYSMDGCVSLCLPCHGPQPRLSRGSRPALVRGGVVFARLQLSIGRRSHSRLKSRAVELDLDMGELGTALLTYGLDLLDAGKVPAQLKTLIEAAVAAKAKPEE